MTTSAFSPDQLGRTGVGGATGIETICGGFGVGVQAKKKTHKIIMKDARKNRNRDILSRKYTKSYNFIYSFFARTRQTF
ncbi:MAG: hypothetical protein AB7P18_24010 [Candidatus Binatia bacterium]